MCRAISILKQRISHELILRYQLAEHVRQRTATADEELVFDFADREHEPQLPVIADGQMVIHAWGNRGNRQSKLPRTGWCRMESLKAGKWRWLHPQQAVIPASFGLEKGVWFPIREGVEGIVVHDENREPRVYMLTQSASHYYQTMTKHERMPVLVGEQI
jgi:hypothetical protein